jgi:hypothetical protein
VNTKRSKRAAEAAQLAAALDGVPAHGYSDDVIALTGLADLLAPHTDTADPFKDAGRERFLRQARVATIEGVDLNAITDADGVKAVHKRSVVLENGGVIHVADVEPVSKDAAAQVADRVAEAQQHKSLRR